MPVSGFPSFMYGFYGIVAQGASDYSAGLLDTTPPKQVPVHWE